MFVGKEFIPYKNSQLVSNFITACLYSDNTESLIRTSNLTLVLTIFHWKRNHIVTQVCIKTIAHYGCVNV